MGQLRKHVRSLSQLARNGDLDAAKSLLFHSIRMGHKKLAVKRFFLARAMGAHDLEECEAYCSNIISDLERDALEIMERDALHQAQRAIAKRNDNV